MVVNYLSKNNIPHNFVLVKADPFDLKPSINSHKANKSYSTTLRAVIWPKRPSYGK